MAILLNRPTTLALTIALTLNLSACNNEQNILETKTSIPASTSTPDKAQAIAFIQDAEAQMAQLSIEANRAEWIYSNFITEDTAALSAAVGEKVSAASVKFATEAAKYANVELDPANARKLNILRSALVLPAPLDPAKMLSWHRSVPSSMGSTEKANTVLLMANV